MHPPGNARRQGRRRVRSGTTIASVIGPRDASPARADPDHLPTGRRGLPRRPVPVLDGGWVGQWRRSTSVAKGRVRRRERAIARDAPCTWESDAACADGRRRSASAPARCLRGVVQSDGAGRALARAVPCTWERTAWPARTSQPPRTPSSTPFFARRGPCLGDLVPCTCTRHAVHLGAERPNNHHLEYATRPLRRRPCTCTERAVHLHDQPHPTQKTDEAGAPKGAGLVTR
jgi:hypothetical protein